MREFKEAGEERGSQDVAGMAGLGMHCIPTISTYEDLQEQGSPQ